MGTQHEENRLEYEETELRLGLPGAGNEKNSGNLKRGFSQTIDLKLNLNASMSSSSSSFPSSPHDVDNHHHQVVKEEEKSAKPPTKAQVVGWPPVRSFRKKILAVQKNGGAAPETDKSGSGAAAVFVKVSLDGAPYLRKVDLKMYSSYQQLSEALGKMFSSFTIGSCGSQGLKDFMSESKLIDLLNGSDYVPTYEDKDGDWMLVGDVPWEMFVDSCKRIRITKSSEAIGLAPRAVEKCKNRV